MPAPLSHIKVLDLSRVMAGPWAGQLLADLGADVIKVERPGAGDDTRSWGPPFLPAPDGVQSRESGYYLSVNRGKRSLTINIDKPEGQEIVRALAGRSDILLENFKVGTLPRYGLGYQDLRQINPRLIYCSVSGFGQTGPKAHKRSEERRVGKECVRSRVDLGGRRIIQAEDGIRDPWMGDWSSDVCSSDLRSSMSRGSGSHGASGPVRHR